MKMGTPPGRPARAAAIRRLPRPLILALAALLAASATVTACSDAGSAPANPLTGSTLWTDPQSSAQQQADAWRQQGQAGQAEAIAPITSQPVATWLTGSTDPYQEAEQVTTQAEVTQQLPVLVLYHRPSRDCGSYSAGGSADAADYLSWVGKVASGIGDRRALLVLEPDAVPQVLSGACGGPDQAAATYRMLGQAVDLLRAQPKAMVYLDAGHPGWIGDEKALAGALQASGVGRANGFSLNVSNFQTTADTESYGDRLSAQLDQAQYVVDVSRNGRGAPAASGGSTASWCNPPSAGLGENPRIGPARARAVAFLWIKEPGSSDGDCQPGQPKAGVFWPDYALQLIRQRGSSG